MDIYRLLDLYKAAIDKCRPFEGEMLEQIKKSSRCIKCFTRASKRNTPGDTVTWMCLSPVRSTP